ncbi:hypothetical protein PENTCL1PPCAC_29646, partial [Pristionchus entomophagus]
MLQLLLGCLLLKTTAESLIPREKLVSDSSNADKFALSPDGKTVGFVSPDANKTRNVFTWRISERQKKQVTFEKIDVIEFMWTGVPDIILFSQDNNGDENTMIFKKNISENAPPLERMVISNTPRVQATLVANNQKDGHVLIGINDETPEYHNVYKFDLLTNELSLVFNNTRFSVESIRTDNDMLIRLAYDQQD